MLIFYDPILRMINCFCNEITATFNIMLEWWCYGSHVNDKIEDILGAISDKWQANLNVVY